MAQGGQVERLTGGSRAVERWLSEQTPGTRRVYGSYFAYYFSWLKARGGFQTPEDLLKDYEGLTSREQYRHIDLVKEFLRSDRYMSKSRHLVLAAIKNFYAFHRMPLPAIGRAEVVKVLRPSEEEIQRRMNETPLQRGEFRELLLACGEPHRTILLLMLQSGMGMAEFQWWNRHGYAQIKDRLDKPGPMRIDIFRVKMSRSEVKRYYSFISEDGKSALKRWLTMRSQTYGPIKEGEPIFLVRSKVKRDPTPPIPNTIRAHLLRAAGKIGLRRKGEGWSKFHPHECRDLFKSLCCLAGVKEVASEYFLGHKIDVDGYNKSPEMDPEAFRQEYLKVAPMLDVFSNSGGEAERKLQSQEAAIKALTTELTTVQERLKQAEESQKVREPSDELMSRLIEDPEVQRVLRRKLKQLGLT